MTSTQWWHGALIYQIYPRSFADSNNDGIGDLPGITAKLDYIASLGVDAIWISPFFTSPMKDFGYDIADYRNVDPMFGSLADFKMLLKKAHELGLKVMIDQVLSHTSDQHHYFLNSREDRTNDYADWYVWADPNADGTAPNNWLSIFGGSAWQWEPRREQYYLHNFLSCQPDLNFHQPAVQQAMLDNVEFWLKLGVDGLRLDAINFCFHDQALRNNPAKAANERVGRGFAKDNPYAYQVHQYNNTQPENLAFLERIRALLDNYPGTAALGEISSEDSLTTMAQYTQRGRLHMGYSFELLTEDASASYVRHTVETLEQRMTQGWPCWSLSNHDVARVASRWRHDEPNPMQAKQLNALVCSLRGSVCLYQGQELGLPEADLPFHALQDPYGITFWPTFKGRDGCRTPMPWQAKAAHAGFSQAPPWLPLAEEHRPLAIDQQLHNEHSTLRQFQQFSRWRQRHPTLRFGDIEFVSTPEPLLFFTRTYQQQTLLCGFNLSNQPVPFHSSWLGGNAGNLRPEHVPGLANAQQQFEHVHFPAYGVFFAQITR
ncbi:MAG: alpha-glucosidase [Ferrimonas sp.]